MGSRLLWENSYLMTQNRNIETPRCKIMSNCKVGNMSPWILCWWIHFFDKIPVPLPTASALDLDHFRYRTYQRAVQAEAYHLL